MAVKTDKPTEKNNKQKIYLRNRIFWGLVNLSIGLLLVIGVALIVRQNVLLPSEYTPPMQVQLSALNTPTPQPTLLAPTPTPEPEPTPYIPVAPIKIYFDAHKKQCEIRPVGLTENNEVDTVPSATIAGWFEQGSSPGDPGNAIISGHISWKGKKGTFSVLHDMEIGEQITIEYADGSVRYFEVYAKNAYKLDNFPSYVTDLDGDTRLTLITCLGDFDTTLRTSRTRVVVECVEKLEMRQPAVNATV